jgi:hypothetical protein
MEMVTQSRMHVAMLSERISDVDCQDTFQLERDPADDRHRVEGGTALLKSGRSSANSSRNGAGWEEHRDRQVSHRSEPRAYSIETFGISAGVLVRSGTHFVFRAVHRAFWELDQCCFKRVAQAERAVQLCWARFQHRSAARLRFNRPQPSDPSLNEPRKLP